MNPTMIEALARAHISDLRQQACRYRLGHPMRNGWRHRLHLRRTH
jgi:hypothetical protein